MTDCWLSLKTDRLTKRLTDRQINATNLQTGQVKDLNDRPRSGHIDRLTAQLTVLLTDWLSEELTFCVMNRSTNWIIDWRTDRRNDLLIEGRFIKVTYLLIYQKQTVLLTDRPSDELTYCLMDRPTYWLSVWIPIDRLTEHPLN